MGFYPYKFVTHCPACKRSRALKTQVVFYDIYIQISSCRCYLCGYRQEEETLNLRRARETRFAFEICLG